MFEKIRQFIAVAQQYAKAIVAGAGSLLVALAGLSDTLGITVIPAEVQPWITFGLGVLTAFATWAIPNIPLPVLPADIQDRFDAVDEFRAELRK